MDSKRFKLTVTGCMVSALDPHGPTLIGTIWQPFDTAELDEAKALAQVGYAEETTQKATAVTRAEKAAGEQPSDGPKLSGIIDAQRQEDGTYKNKAGGRVHKDGSEFLDGDDAILATLDKPADEIIAGLKGELSPEAVAALPRLAALETVYKNRKTVNEAFAAAQQPKE